MQRIDHAYEKPSRISQGLVVCLSVAVVLMAGWLAITIMLSRHATVSAIGSPDTAGAHGPVEIVSPEPGEPRVAPRLSPAFFEPPPRDYTSATPTPRRSALPLASLAEPPPAATRDDAYAPLSIATAVPDVNFRGIPTPAPYPPLRAPSLPYPAGGGAPRRGQTGEITVGATPSIDAADAIADLMELPPPPPSSAPPRAGEGRAARAYVPVPRPRPRLESEDVQSIADQPSFDFLVDRRR